MGNSLAAAAVMVFHLLYIAFVIVGGLLAWRWPRLLRFHVPTIVVSVALAFSGKECPLTDVEKWFRRRAGETPYEDGFISHYLVEPLHPGGTTPLIRTGLRVAIIAITAVAYVGYLAGHRARGRGARAGTLGRARVG